MTQIKIDAFLLPDKTLAQYTPSGNMLAYVVDDTSLQCCDCADHSRKMLKGKITGVHIVPKHPQLFCGRCEDSFHSYPV